MGSFIEFMTSDYVVGLAILVGIYAILAQAYNLAFGFAKLFNFAHVASYALGAYTTALLSTEMGWSFASCAAASPLVAGLSAILIGAVSLRLADDYFAIGTLALAAIVQAFLINWKSLTHGVLGIPGIPRPSFGEYSTYDNPKFLLLVVIFAVVVQMLLYWTMRGPFGRTLRAQGENFRAAQALGKDVVVARNLTFFISSAFAGLAGSFFALYLYYIDPSSFSLNEMVFALTIVIVGGPGAFWGCLAGTFIMVLLPEPLRFIDIPSSVLGQARQFLYACALFGVLYWRRRTLFPVERKI